MRGDFVFVHGFTQTAASWAGGVYENQYVRENGVWKFKDVRYLPQYSGRYEEPGWTAAREPAPRQFGSHAPSACPIVARDANRRARRARSP